MMAKVVLPREVTPNARSDRIVNLLKAITTQILSLCAGLGGNWKLHWRDPTSVTQSIPIGEIESKSSFADEM